ncbi:MAG: hypothetical protein H6709_13075, partial [Kofleriaceae bacterium]|nr:hypothetical protein [Kofleriaceae bacterium]
MRPLPFPHRVSFLWSTMHVPAQLARLAPASARLLAYAIHDHLVRHPVVSIGEVEDDALLAADGAPIDAGHAEVDDALDALFRLGRRHEVLWLEVALDPARPTVTLRSRRPRGDGDAWTSDAAALSAQLGDVIDRWLAARHLPRARVMPPFGADELADVAARLERALAAARDADAIPDELLAPPPRLGVPYLRALGAAGLVDDWAERLLALDAGNPVARRHQVVSALRGGGDRRAILPVIADAPMYGPSYLAVWGDPFAADRPREGMGLRHQGVAAMLAPASPWACHNYSVQLRDVRRREESYRWADRATIASAEFDQAHLDCVRRLREVQRPGQAFAEAAFRCGEVLERWRDGDASADWAVRYHAGMLQALVHHDIGRLDDAIHIAEDTLRDVGDREGGVERFGWAAERIAAWRDDPRVLARAFAREGYHRGDPGRVLVGLARAGIDDHDDVYMTIDAMIATGREDLARLAFHHVQGLGRAGVIGDGKGRLAGATALLLGGDLDEALEHLQVVQLRRGQSRLEAAINRLLRLAACHPADAWEAVIARRLEVGATTLARRAARDLADFVPGMATPTVRRALGERAPWTVDALWLVQLTTALPRLGAAGPAIDLRLAPPLEQSLAAADILAQDWWTVLPPAARDRDAHAEAALYALGVALARYLAATSGNPTPIAGAYRHVATEALQLVRRSRYQLEDRAVRGLLELLERCAERVLAGAGTDAWLLDTWLLRVEHALDLDAEQGSFLPGLLDGLPHVAGLWRGDERVGWELRTAWDLAAMPDQGAPARALFERCARAMETGAAEAAWSALADELPAADALDVHWLAATANPSHLAAPWLALARAQLTTRPPRIDDALESLWRASRGAGDDERAAVLAAIEPAWRAAGVDVPFDFAAAQARGLAALLEGEHEQALRCLRWCQALDPRDPVVAKNVGIAHASLGEVHRAVRAFAGFDRDDAARHAGAALMQAGRYAEATLALRYAMPRLTTPDDWRMLAVSAWYAEDDAVAAIGYQRYLDAGAAADPQTLHGLATALYASGQWDRCEEVARRLLAVAGDDPTFRACGLHAMARALAGRGKFGDAARCATEAAQLAPLADAVAEYQETARLCQAGEAPPWKPSPETSVERTAWDALAAGDMATPERLAMHGNSWGLFRAALTASEARGDRDQAAPVASRAIDAAQLVLDRSVGTTAIDAALCRVAALRIREHAGVQIDPPPPLGSRMSRDRFEQEGRRRGGAGASAARAAAADADVDDGDSA